MIVGLRIAVRVLIGRHPFSFSTSDETSIARLSFALGVAAGVGLIGLGMLMRAAVELGRGAL